jgi:hypothetical protein
MAKERIMSGCARLAGVLLVLSAIPHATLGMAEVITSIKTGDVRASMADTFRAIWMFGSVMLLLSGLWALFVAGELRQLKPRAWWQGIIIGLGYTAWAIGSMVLVGVQAHLVAFSLIGLVMLVPLLIWAPHFFRTSHIKSTF